MLSTQSLERPIYAGNAIQTVKSLSNKKVITVNLHHFKLLEIKIIPIDINSIENKLSEHISDELTKSDRPEQNCQVVVSGGRVCNLENFVLLKVLQIN